MTATAWGQRREARQMIVSDPQLGTAALSNPQIMSNLVGAEYCVTSCGQGVFMDPAAGPVSAQHAHPGLVAGWRCVPSGRVVLERPVRPVDGVVAGVLAQGWLPVPFAGDQHPARAGAADPATRRSGSPGAPAPVP